MNAPSAQFRALSEGRKREVPRGIPSCQAECQARWSGPVGEADYLAPRFFWVHFGKTTGGDTFVPKLVGVEIRAQKKSGAHFGSRWLFENTSFQ